MYSHQTSVDVVYQMIQRFNSWISEIGMGAAYHLIDELDIAEKLMKNAPIGSAPTQNVPPRNCNMSTIDAYFRPI